MLVYMYEYNECHLLFCSYLDTYYTQHFEAQDTIFNVMFHHHQISSNTYSNRRNEC